MNKKGTVSLTLSIAMIANSTGSMAVFAENNTKKYEYDGYTVYYSVVSEWENNQNVNVKIKNKGNKTIENWAVEYYSEGQIGSIWNGAVYDHEDGFYVIKNAGYNHAIEPGKSVDFGYMVEGENLSVPENIRICTEIIDITDECGVYYNVVNDYGSRYQAEIIINNSSDETIESWELSASSSCEVDNVWNGKLSEKTADGIVIVSDENTYNIAPGKSIAINVQGSKSADDEVVFGDFSLKTNKVIPSGKTGGTVESGETDYTYIPHLPETSDMFIACAEYDNEKIYFEWTYSDTNGEYSVYETTSDKKVKIGAVSDKNVFEYNCGEITGTKKFVIERTFQGVTVSSNPITVYVDEEGYIVSEYPDTDSDGVYDIYEHIFGTDPEKPDTDGDELGDYEELYMFGTDPLNPDSDDDRLPDGFEVYQTGTEALEKDSLGEGKIDDLYDLDDDNLTNYEEYVLGTDPLCADSDNDGLDDYAEVREYKTNPNEIDTDDDYVSDCDEIQLGLDPNNPETNRYPDAEYTVSQKISSDSDIFSEINNSEKNPFKISVEMDCAGVIENNLYADESGYTAAVSNESIIGIVPELFYPEDLTIDSFKIKFDLNSKAVVNNNSCHKESDTKFEGLERFEVFKMFEDYNMLLPLKTYYDTAKNEVYAITDAVGTYCLVDLELWENMLDCTDSSGITGVEVMSKSTSSPIKLSGLEKEEVDVFFVIDGREKHFSEDDIRTIIKSIKRVIKKLANATSKKYNVYVYWTNGSERFNEFIEYTDEEVVNLKIKTFEKNTQFLYDVVLNQLIDEKKKSEKNNKAYLLIINDNDKTRYSLKKFPQQYSLIDELSENNISVSIISNPERVNSFDFGTTLIRNTGGIFINYNSSSKKLDFSSDVLKYILGNYDKGDINVINPMNFKSISLKGNILSEDRNYLYSKKYSFLDYDRIDNNHGFVDSDNDGLFDVEEIMFFWDETNTDTSNIDNVAIHWDDDGTLVLPTFSDVLDKLHDKYPYLDNAKDIYDDLTDSTSILPIKSDPSVLDSDRDGITDYNEVFAIETEKYLEKKKKSISEDKLRNYYKCSLNPLIKDTVESIVKNNITVTNNERLSLGALKNKVKNNLIQNYPVAIDITQNTITIDANVCFPKYYTETKSNLSNPVEFYSGTIIKIDDATVLTFYNNCTIEYSESGKKITKKIVIPETGVSSDYKFIADKANNELEKNVENVIDSIDDGVIKITSNPGNNTIKITSDRSIQIANVINNTNNLLVNSEPVECYEGTIVSFTHETDIQFDKDCTVIVHDNSEEITKNTSYHFSVGDQLILSKIQNAYSVTEYNSTVRMMHDKPVEINLVSNQVKKSILSWAISGKGSEYDFYPGLNFNVYVNIHDLTFGTEDDQKNSIKIYLKSSFYDGNAYSNYYTKPDNKKPFIYICRFTQDSIDVLNDVKCIGNTPAHEFGHIMGLLDAYPDRKDLNIIQNIPSTFAPYTSLNEVPKTDIMRAKYATYDEDKRIITENDIEMVLMFFAQNDFSDDSKVSFIPNNYMSVAIKTPYYLIYDKNNNLYYYINDVSIDLIQTVDFRDFCNNNPEYVKYYK